MLCTQSGYEWKAHRDVDDGNSGDNNDYDDEIPYGDGVDGKVLGCVIYLNERLSGCLGKNKTIVNSF